MKNLVLATLVALSLGLTSLFAFNSTAAAETKVKTEVLITDDYEVIIVIDGIIYKITYSDIGVKAVEVIGSVHD